MATKLFSFCKSKLRICVTYNATIAQLFCNQQQALELTVCHRSNIHCV